MKKQETQKFLENLLSVVVGETLIWMNKTMTIEDALRVVRTTPELAEIVRSTTQIATDNAARCRAHARGEVRDQILKMEKVDRDIMEYSLNVTDRSVW